MASEWYDYHEYKNYLYGLRKNKERDKNEWDKLDQSIKRFLWNEEKKLLGEANADMEIDSSNDIELYDLQTDDSDSNKKRRKKRKKGGYVRAYSIDRAFEDGIDYPDAFTPERYVIQQETNQALYAAINMLDEKGRDIIILYYFGELTERQIGEILNMKQKTVNNHKNNSLKKMRTFLEKTQ